MSLTTANVSSGLPLPARGMSSDDLVRHLNDDVREDIRQDLYDEFDGTYTKTQRITIELPTKPTTELSGVAGVLDNGDYRYKITFVTANGESRAGDESVVLTVLDNSTSGQVSLTGIPTGKATTTTARKIYRQKDGKDNYKLVATIADNTTVIYTDNIAEVALGAIAPNGWTLPSDFYSVIQLKHENTNLEMFAKSPDNPEGDYALLDYQDNPSDTSKIVIGLPDSFAYAGELVLLYRPIIAAVTDGGDLPYPLALQNRLLPILRLGTAFYHLSELSGEDEHIIRVGNRYEVAKSQMFQGNISYTR